ncbi:MAG: hypothetical protein ABIH46_06535 [Chloroflexota bacterium]
MTNIQFYAIITFAVATTHIDDMKQGDRMVALAKQVLRSEDLTKYNETEGPSLIRVRLNGYRHTHTGSLKELEERLTEDRMSRVFVMSHPGRGLLDIFLQKVDVTPPSFEELVATVPPGSAVLGANEFGGVFALDISKERTGSAVVGGSPDKEGLSLLRVAACSLAYSTSPDELELVAIDMSGGVSYGALEMPHWKYRPVRLRAEVGSLLENVCRVIDGGAREKRLLLLVENLGEVIEECGALAKEALLFIARRGPYAGVQYIMCTHE